MIATFLIGLREGLEATLVVSILLAYLIKAQEGRGVVPLLGGVAAAVAVSILFAFGMDLIASELRFKTQELFEGIASIIAVGLVTWMVFWMRKTARFLKSELQDKMESAINLGPFAVAGVAFVAVTREGLETVLFLRQTVQSTGETALPLLGALLGIATAIALGVALFYGAMKLNFKRFFTWTGVLLILVAAGVLRYGVHDLQEADVLPGIGSHAFDISAVLDPTSWYGTLLQGTFNIVPNPSWLEVGAWVAYIVPVMFLFLWQRQPKPAPTTTRA